MQFSQSAPTHSDRRRLSWVGLFAAVTLSGVAGLLNQVAWQRGLKVFLGGSETLSAMIVVLVFLLGLGLGAGLAARRARTLQNPVFALVVIEACLAAINLAVALLLGLDIADSVAAMQRLAVSAGIPLQAVYALVGSLLLLPPTVLMGATIPVSSEAAQRQFRGRSPVLLQALVVVNTVGGALGAYGAGAWLLPMMGQRATLLIAVGCNATAALCLGLVSRVKAADAAEGSAMDFSGRVRRDEVLGAVLGFLALGYEMVLFRILALLHEPLPTTFSIGLAAFLLAWSAGVWFASVRVWRVASLAVVGAAAIGLVVWLFEQEFRGTGRSPAATVGFYLGPCIVSGVLYGALLARVARDWGRDVGRFTAATTLGSCVGVLVFTLVGHEMPVGFSLSVIGISLLAVAAWDLGARWLVIVPGMAVLGIAVAGVRTRYSEHEGTRTYWGRDGVVQILPSRDVRIDGLWHTKLSDGSDHVGQVYNWLMAFAAVVAHGGAPTRALVVGAGVGISGMTLAGVDGLQVDGYEINQTLRRVLEDYPEGTLGALRASDITWRWRDARVGLALDPRTYDIILSAPLHLRQAGSSLLLSREYLRLAKSRLAPRGVMVVYSSETSQAQARLVQATIAECFRYRVTWYSGLLTVASDSPITLSEESLRLALSRPDRLFQEATRLDVSLSGEGGLWAWYDGEPPAVLPGTSVVTDDQPLVEYPTLVDARMR